MSASTAHRHRHTKLPARFPAAPVQTAIRSFAQRHALSLEGVAIAIALDSALLGRVMERRWLPWPLADTLAIALGTHPSLLWPDWFGRMGRPSSVPALGASRTRR
jgi:lambda repressor-like predicted transcriptional regulator